MECKENSLDAEESYLSPAHPELSLSSGVISLPSANKLADLSLTSDITDSDAENEPTVLTSRPCSDHKDGADGTLHRENKKMSSDPLKPSTSPRSHQSVNLLEKKLNTEAIAQSHCREIISSTNKEMYKHESNVSDEEPLRDFYPSVNVTHGEAVLSLPNLSLVSVRGTLQQNCNFLSDRCLLKDLLESLDEKIELEPRTHVTVQNSHSGRVQKISPIHEKGIGNDFRENDNALNVLDKQFPSEPSTVSCLKSYSGESASFANAYQGSQVLNEAESLRKSQLDHHDAHATSALSQKHIYTTMLYSKPAGQEVLEKSNCEKHVKLQSLEGSIQDPLLDVEDEEYKGTKELFSTQQSLKVLQ